MAEKREQRGAQRYAIRLACQLMFVDARGQRATSPGKLRDISMRGACLETDVDLPTGRMVTLALAGVGGEPLLARVVRELRRTATARVYGLAVVEGGFPYALFTSVAFAAAPASAAKATAPCLVALGLTWPCDAGDVQRAFRRLAKSSHPDSGGSDTEFRELQAAYEEALRLISQRR